MNVVFICGGICSGKSTLAKQLADKHFSDFQPVEPELGETCWVEVSDFVRMISNGADRKSLQGTGGSVDKIIGHLKSVVNEVAKRHGFNSTLYISGARQVEILRAFPQATFMWLETPEFTRFQRWMDIATTKDRVKNITTWGEANKFDNQLGLGDLKHYILNNSRP